MKKFKLKDISENEIIREIKKGLVFIYPTDTVYGLGCDATNSKSVKRIRQIKNANHPFSVIAPGKDWIIQNFIVNKRELKRLPGPYTLVLEMKKRVVAEEVNLGLDTLGIRIPNHIFSYFVNKANVPFVSTSLNFSGSKTIENLGEVPKEILDKVDIIIDEGILNNMPSEVIDLSGKKKRILRKREKS